jgi:hypothetical protein
LVVVAQTAPPKYLAIYCLVVEVTREEVVVMVLAAPPTTCTLIPFSRVTRNCSGCDGISSSSNYLALLYLVVEVPGAAVVVMTLAAPPPTLLFSTWKEMYQEQQWLWWHM